MKILVLGANGQVGSEMATALSGANNPRNFNLDVVMADRSDLDLSNVSKIGSFLKEVAPDFVINAAAYTAVDKAESEKDLAVEINFDAVREIALYCKRSGAPMVHISTDYVFDGNRNEPYTESDEVGPNGVYGQSKFLGEEVIRDLTSAHIILRTSWVFGSHGSNFVKTMLTLAANNDELRVVSDQLGSPTSSKAIADAIASIVFQMGGAGAADERWGTYHFSGLPYVSWADFADEIFNQAVQLGIVENRPKINPISTIEYPTTAIRPANSCLDGSKCNIIFGIEPNDWNQSLREVLVQLKSTG